jgi:hypothetical protein
MNNYSITFNGLTIGYGTNFPITKIEGLASTSPLRIQDDNRGYIDGSYTGRDFYDERTVYIDVTVLGDNSTTAQSNYKLLQAAFSPQVVGYYVNPTGYTPSADQLKLFQFRLSNSTGDQQMYGRSRGLTTEVDPNFTYGYIQTRIQMTFPDPRYYDSTGTISAGTGILVYNQGWATSCPVITIASPNSSGTISDGTIFMDFNYMPSGALVIDLLSRIVYVNGNPLRNVLQASSNGWLSIPPNSYYYWASTVGSMSVTFRNTYV